MLRFIRKGQSTAEYAIVIGLVIAAAVAMQVYVKRGLQSKIKAATDYTDTDAVKVVGNTGGQYEPYYQQSEMTATNKANETETTAAGGQVKREVVNNESTRTGTSTVLAPEQSK